MKYKTLSIAGFDGSGGAGIQADLKTFSALSCYGMTVLTALPVQNTCGVRKCYSLPLTAIQEQLEAIFDDIPPDSIKIGMLFSTEIIEVVAQFLKERATGIPIVLDPVMLAKNGDPLLQESAITALRDTLLPLASVITPNIPEAQILTNLQTSDPSMLAEALLALKTPAVLVKGGHAKSDNSDDLLCEKNTSPLWLRAQRIASKNLHGTGCTLSAAIAAKLAHGFSLPDACRAAKNYLSAALLAASDYSIGKGHGPVHHFHAIW